MENINEQQFTVRKVTLEELYSKLKNWHERKLDVVINSKSLLMEEGRIISKEAFENQYYYFEPNSLMHRQIATKLGIPYTYYERMLTNLLPLLDSNVTSWLQKESKRHLIRSYTNDGGRAMGRAFLSDSYKLIDNFYVLMAVLDAINENNLNVQVESADITESKMYVRFFSPDAVQSAKSFLEKYANPETGEYDDGVMAGFTLSNSEVGQGSFHLSGRAIARVCKNGMIGDKSKGMQKIHMGKKVEEGIWSQETMDRYLKLIKSEAKDYVKYFSGHEFLKSTIDFFETAGRGKEEIQHPQNAVINSCKILGISEGSADSIMKLFIKSKDTRRSGLVGAITYFAQEQDDADLQMEIENKVSELLTSTEVDTEKVLIK